MPVLALIELWSHEQAPLDGAVIRRLLRGAVPYVALSLAYWGVHRSLFPARAASGFGLLEHAGLVLEAYGRYSALVLWPDDLTLGRAWLHSDRSGVAISAAYVLLGATSVLLVLALAWRARQARPALALGLLAYLALLLPVSGVIWRGNDVLVSPRFLYLPLVGLALAAASLLELPAARRRLAVIACGVVLACLGARSFARAADFESEQTFWRREIIGNPSYGPAQQYFVYRELNAGRPRAALQLAQRWYASNERAGASQAQKSRLLMGMLAASLRAIPDLDTESLERVQRFAQALATTAPAELVLPAQGLSLS
jgi:hypothetical protein